MIEEENESFTLRSKQAGDAFTRGLVRWLAEHQMTFVFRNESGHQRELDLRLRKQLNCKLSSSRA